MKIAAKVALWASLASRKKKKLKNFLICKSKNFKMCALTLMIEIWKFICQTKSTRTQRTM
jgi:hypothetical protein